MCTLSCFLCSGSIPCTSHLTHCYQEYTSRRGPVGCVECVWRVMACAWNVILMYVHSLCTDFWIYSPWTILGTFEVHDCPHIFNTGYMSIQTYSLHRILYYYYYYYFNFSLLLLLFTLDLNQRNNVWIVSSTLVATFVHTVAKLGGLHRPFDF